VGPGLIFIDTGIASDYGGEAFYLIFKFLGNLFKPKAEKKIDRRNT
jgi:hypothetical protein